jgi:hypothetical protein
MLDRLFEIWFDYAVRTEGYFPQEVRDLIGPDDYPPAPEHKWHWDGFFHVDPTREANAQTERFRNGTEHLADAWSKNGRIWHREVELAAKSFGLTKDEYLAHIRGYLWTRTGSASPAQQSQNQPRDRGRDQETREDRRSGVGEEDLRQLRQEIKRDFQVMLEEMADA